MTKLTIWMRIVGIFYLLQFVMMAVVRAPIRVQGPAGTLRLADAGDPLAKFVVDTWLTFGLEVGAVGAALLLVSRRPLRGRGVAWTVLGIELTRGLLNDVYMLLTRGDDIAFYATWIVIHSTVIVTGLLVLRATASQTSVASNVADHAASRPSPDQPRSAINQHDQPGGSTMPKYVIERDLPGAGALTDDEITAISEKSNGVLADLGGDVQWLHSYVTDDKLFCVYIAPNEQRVREHASRGGFPANSVLKVARTIDPTTGER